MRLTEIRSSDALRAAAADWDSLWARSGAGSPLFRAQSVAHWLDTFAAGQPWTCLAVDDGQAWRAALVVVPRVLGRLVRLADTATNCWSPCGELLLDPAHPTAVQPLLAALAEGPWRLAWFQYARLEAASWQTLVRLAPAAGFGVVQKQRYAIGIADMPDGFDAYAEAGSKNLRRNLRKDLRRLERAGTVSLRLQERFAPDEVEAPLRAAFEVEDRSWKGAAGSSVLHTPGMFDYFLQQARLLASWNALRIAFLDVAGEPIAFEYGWQNGATYYSFKVGYDPRYASFGPGHLMRMHLLRALSERGVRSVDFHGPLTEALRPWANRRYAIGRLVLAPPRLVSRVLLAGLAAWDRYRGQATDARPSLAASPA